MCLDKELRSQAQCPSCFGVLHRATKCGCEQADSRSNSWHAIETKDFVGGGGNSAQLPQWFVRAKNGSAESSLSNRKPCCKSNCEQLSLLVAGMGSRRGRVVILRCHLLPCKSKTVLQKQLRTAVFAGSWHGIETWQNGDARALRWLAALSSCGARQERGWHWPAAWLGVRANNARTRTRTA